MARVYDKHKNDPCRTGRTRNDLSLWHTDPLYGVEGFFSITKDYLGTWNEITSAGENKLVHLNKERRIQDAEYYVVQHVI